MAHGLHNAAKQIRANYKDVDKLIAAVKVSVVKNKDQRAKFSTINSLPQPVVTRWESWLKAAEYYAKNFPQVCEIVSAYEGTWQLVVKAKEVLAAESLPGSQREIYRCYIKHKEQRTQNIPLLKPIKEVTHLSLATIQVE